MSKLDDAVDAVLKLHGYDDWPTNEDLGGHWGLGTRDDEYRAQVYEDARAILELLGVEED